MQIIGILLMLLGVYALIKTEKVMNLLDGTFYKRERKPTKKNILTARLLSLLWIAAGLAIFLKSM